LSSSSSYADKVVFAETLQPNESIPLWFKMELNASEVSYKALDKFNIIIDADDDYGNDIQETYEIQHTRFNLVPSNIRWEWIRSKTHYIRVKFDHVVDSSYYGGTGNVVYAAYINDQLVKNFTTNQIDLFVGNIDERFKVDILAVPCTNFYYILDDTTGNSVALRFRTKRFDIADIDHFNVQWDNKTGTLLDEVIGRVDAETGIVKGKKVQRGGIIGKLDITGFHDEFESSSSSSESSSSQSSKSSSSHSSSSTEHSSSSLTSSLSSSSSSSKSQDPTSSQEFSSWTSSSQSSSYSSVSSSSGPDNPFPEHAFKFTHTIPAEVFP